jgi:hypothetical protein
MTNDGHAILREIDVKHPAAKSMIELSRAQDEEVGDGTTSVIILAGIIAWIHKRCCFFFGLSFCLSLLLRPNSHTDDDTGEMLHVAEPLLERKIHPTVITQVCMSTRMWKPEPRSFSCIVHAYTIPSVFTMRRPPCHTAVFTTPPDLLNKRYQYAAYTLYEYVMLNSCAEFPCM